MAKIHPVRPSLHEQCHVVGPAKVRTDGSGSIAPFHQGSFRYNFVVRQHFKYDRTMLAGRGIQSNDCRKFYRLLVKRNSKNTLGMRPDSTFKLLAAYNQRGTNHAAVLVRHAPPLQNIF